MALDCAEKTSGNKPIDGLWQENAPREQDFIWE
jgi:hypothetical protein